MKRQTAWLLKMGKHLLHTRECGLHGLCCWHAQHGACFTGDTEEMGGLTILPSRWPSTPLSSPSCLHCVDPRCPFPLLLWPPSLPHLSPWASPQQTSLALTPWPSLVHHLPHPLRLDQHLQNLGRGRAELKGTWDILENDGKASLKPLLTPSHASLVTVRPVTAVGAASVSGTPSPTWAAGRCSQKEKGKLQNLSPCPRLSAMTRS